MSTLNFENLLGRTFLLPPQAYGECKHAKTVDRIVGFDDVQATREDQLHIKICVQDPEQFEEFISYNHLMDYMEQHTDLES